MAVEKKKGGGDIKALAWLICYVYFFNGSNLFFLIIHILCKRSIFLFIIKVRESSYFYYTSYYRADFARSLFFFFFFYGLVKVHIKTQLTLERDRQNC